MYIPLAGVVWLVVTIFVNTFADKRSPVDRTAWRMLVPAIVVILALMTATHLRNQMYHSRIGMWAQIFQQDTTNWRANYNMACRSLYAGEPDVAFEFADHAVAKNPRSDVFNELAQDLNAAGDFVTAERFARRASQIRTETLGAKDRDTLKSAADLIAALRNKGDAAAAAALAATSIGVMRRELGADHDTTLLVTTVIAATAAESGNCSRRGAACTGGARIEQRYPRQQAAHPPLGDRCVGDRARIPGPVFRGREDVRQVGGVGPKQPYFFQQLCRCSLQDGQPSGCRPAVPPSARMKARFQAGT